MKKGPKTAAPPTLDGQAVISDVLARTRADVQAATTARIEQNHKLESAGKRLRPKGNEKLSFAIYFAKHMGNAIAAGLRSEFPTVRSGENPSMSVRGPKRVDLNFSTPEMGLGFAISFKSVHLGEKDGGNADFIHNLKRNDEELRGEAAAHHIRQPFAVLVALVFLPFESCTDLSPSSFASWVQYLWPLKGRAEPEDPADRFELVFMGLYARDGSRLGFYEVGGPVPCPREGPPKELLSLSDFLKRVTSTYDRRNGRDFHFEGEGPAN